MFTRPQQLVSIPHCIHVPLQALQTQTRSSLAPAPWLPACTPGPAPLPQSHAHPSCCLMCPHTAEWDPCSKTESARPSTACQQPRESHADLHDSCVYANLHWRQSQRRPGAGKAGFKRNTEPQNRRLRGSRSSPVCCGPDLPPLWVDLGGKLTPAVTLIRLLWRAHTDTSR